MPTKAELQKENELLTGQVQGFEGTMRTLIADRNHWDLTARQNYTEMIKQRKRADDAETRLAIATATLGEIMLSEIEDALKRRAKT
jgi:hypothetical protein